jgi:heme transport system ATP-binding protein
MTPAIAANALSVCVGLKALVDDVTFSVEPGETVALVGPNGAGKSTLLRALSGEISPSGGTVYLKGRRPHSYPPRELAQHRAVLSQNVTVAFPFTVAEVVRMGAGQRQAPAVEALVDAALTEVDLNGFRARIINTLSGGEQQRAHFARVLVQLHYGEKIHGPGVLLLDEPTASLDLRHQIDLVAAARRRSEQGTTVITIVHDLNLATLLAARVVVLGSGRIVADGPARRSISDEVLQQVFGVACAVDRIPESEVPFVLPHHARKCEAPSASRSR